MILTQQPISVTTMKHLFSDPADSTAVLPHTTIPEGERRRVLTKYLIKLTHRSFATEEQEQFFRRQFTEVYPEYIYNLRSEHPDITRGEEFLAILILMKLTSMEIAAALGISEQGVKKMRYRLRKRLKLDSKESLEESVCRFLY